jgi:predicted restriction endonuclease
LAIECEQLRQYLLSEHGVTDPIPHEFNDGIDIADFVGETRRAVIQQRIKQSFFRRAVLSSYRGRCCMSGVSESRLLVASHIVPWRADKANRLNPSNGLCLSAIHDKAFDNGLISLSDDLCILVSARLLASKTPFIDQVFKPIVGQSIEVHERFAPNQSFIRHHRTECFKAD